MIDVKNILFTKEVGRKKHPNFQKVFKQQNKDGYWINKKFSPRTCAEVLNKTYRIVLRSKVRDPYMLNHENMCFEPVTVEQIQEIIREDMGEENLTTPSQIKKSLDYIDEYVTPAKNIIAVENGQYDLERHMFYGEDELEKPLERLCLVKVPIPYVYDAEPTYIKEFLESSLAEDDAEATYKKIEGVLQIIGYLLTSGNTRAILPIFSGVQGSGKSVLAKIITALFNNMVCHVDLQRMTSNSFAFAPFLYSRLNIITDSKSDSIRDNGVIKAASGNDDLLVEEKGKDIITLSKDEVPKTIMMCNQIPYFVNQEDALLERMVIVEFKHSFRNTDDQIMDLDEKIINNEHDMQWLLYGALEAYANFCYSHENRFLLQNTPEVTRHALEKHSDPLAWCISEMISHYEEPEEDDYDHKISDYRMAVDDLITMIINYAEEEGIDLPLSKSGKITGRRLNPAIRRSLDIDDKEFSPYNTRVDGVLTRMYRGLVMNEKGRSLYTKYCLEEE